MKIGKLFVGWKRLDEADRISFGLDPWPLGWEMLHIQWNDNGFGLIARPRRMKK